MEYCESRWEESVRPIESWKLVNFIEQMLRELQSCGIGYPRVLLLRKKKIQRKTFIPAEKEKTAFRAGRGEICTICRGTGWEAVHYPGSAPSYRPCKCQAREEAS